jgi:hypothetical protein
VRLDGEDWSSPTLQERRAIIYSAKSEIEELTELIEILQDGRIAGLQDDLPFLQFCNPAILQW